MSDLSETILQAIKASGTDIGEVMVDARRIDEVERIFGETLDRETIVAILQKHDSNVDAALPELFSANEASQRKRQSQLRLERLQSRVQVLTEAFAGVPVEEVTRVVEENDGDLEAASAVLLDRMQANLEAQEKQVNEKRQEEVQAKKDELLAQRRALVDHCGATFEVLSRSEIAETLTKANWELSKAVDSLKSASEQRKVGNLMAVLPEVKEARVRAALVAHKWDCSQACLALTNAAPASPPKAEALEQDASDAIAAAIEQSKKESQEILESFIRGKVRPGAGGPAPPRKLPQGAPEPESPQAPTEAPKAAPEAPAPATDSAAISVRFVLGSPLVAYSGKITADVIVAGGEASAYDYVTLVREGETDENNYVSWNWYKGAPLSFASPGYGRFELRYVRKTASGETVALAGSQPITVGPSLTLGVSQADNVWTVTPTHNGDSEALSSSAWVGLFDGDRLLDYKYIKSGVPVSFEKPAINSTYHFRAYVSRWNGPNATSERLVVSGDDTISMRQEGTKIHVSVVAKSADPTLESVWVWVGHALETRPGYYRRFRYLKEPTASFTFKTPIHAGNYECRLYRGQDEVLAKASEIVVVE